MSFQGLAAINDFGFTDVLGSPHNPEDFKAWRGHCVIALGTGAMGVVEGMRDQKLVCARTAVEVVVQQNDQTIMQINQGWDGPEPDLYYVIPKSFLLPVGFRSHKIYSAFFEEWRQRKEEDKVKAELAAVQHMVRIMAQVDSTAAKWHQLASETMKCNIANFVPAPENTRCFLYFGELATDGQVAHQALSDEVTRIALQRISARAFECKRIPWTFHTLEQHGPPLCQIVQPMPLPMGAAELIQFEAIEEPLA